MLFSQKMNAAINERLPELAKHFYRQAEEERDHAMRFVKYVVDAGGKMAIPAIPAPKSAFASAEEAVRNSLEWEVTVTKRINALVDLAIQETDHTTQNFPVVCHRAAGRSVQHGDTAKCRATRR